MYYIFMCNARAQYIMDNFHHNTGNLHCLGNNTKRVDSVYRLIKSNFASSKYTYTVLQSHERVQAFTLSLSFFLLTSACFIFVLTSKRCNFYNAVSHRCMHSPRYWWKIFRRGQKLRAPSEQISLE